MNLLKKLALFCALAPSFVLAQTSVTGTKIIDNMNSLLSSGQWCLASTCFAVTNGVIAPGSSLTGATGTITITNAGATLTYLTVPGVTVSGSTFSWDRFVLPTNGTASGLGMPRIACSVGTTYTQTDASNAPWTCASINGINVWVGQNIGAAAPPGAYTATNAPTFACTSPCSYTRIDASPATSAFYALLAPAGVASTNWVLQAGTGAVLPSTPAIVKSVTSLTSTPAVASDIVSLFGSCSAGQVLSATGTCVSNGGSVLGTQYRISGFTGSGSGPSTGLGQTNAFTDATGNPLTVPGALAGKITNGTINTDLNGGVVSSLAACGSSPCVYQIPATSPDTTQIYTQTDAANGQQWDLTDGRGLYGAVRYIQNMQGSGVTPTGFMTPSGHQIIYGQTGTAGLNQGVSFLRADLQNFFKIGGGVSVDGKWTNVAHRGDINGQWYNTRGQSYMNAYNPNFFKVGDSIIDEVNAQFRAACTGFTDECQKWTAHHLLEIGTLLGPIALGGTGTGPGGTNPTSIQLNFGAQNNGFVMDGGFLLSADEPVSTVTTYDSCVGSPDQIVPELCHTTTTHPADTWQATLVTNAGANPCGADNIRDAKVTDPTNNVFTCLVNVTVAGTVPPVGAAVTFADVQKYEGATVTSSPAVGTGARTIGVRLTYSHTLEGTKIMFGGMAGTFGVFAGGQSDPTTDVSKVISTFPIGGSPDATHEYVITNYNESQQGVQNIIMPAPVSEAIGSLSCSGGAVSFGAATFGDLYLDITPVGIQQYVVAGNSASDYNGVVTNVHVNQDGSGTWTAPGSTCTSPNGTGGTITLTHAADVFAYKGAEVTAIASGTMDSEGELRPSGLVHLDGNNAIFATGMRAMQPNRVESNVQMYTSQLVVNTPSLIGDNKYDYKIVTGMGMSGETLETTDTGNNLDPVHGDYYGAGGRNIGVEAHQYDLPMDGWNFALGMIPGATLHTIECFMGPANCSATQADNILYNIGAAGVTGRGILRWQGSNSKWYFQNPVIYHNGFEAQFASVMDGNVPLQFQSIATGNLYQLLECDAFHGTGRWCWGTNPSSGAAQDGQMEMGQFQTDVLHGLTGFNGTVQKPACLSDGTDCPGTAGTAVLVAGTVTVSTSAAQAISTSHGYQVTNCIAGGTPGFLNIGTVTAGTSFVIHSSSATDTSTVCWRAY